MATSTEVIVMKVGDKVRIRTKHHGYVVGVITGSDKIGPGTVYLVEHNTPGHPSGVNLCGQMGMELISESR